MARHRYYQDGAFLFPLLLSPYNFTLAFSRAHITPDVHTPPFFLHSYSLFSVSPSLLQADARWERVPSIVDVVEKCTTTARHDVVAV